MLSDLLVLELASDLAVPAGLRQTAFPHPADNPLSLAPPPHYAEHTAAILRDRPGYAPEKVQSLIDRDGVHI